MYTGSPEDIAKHTRLHLYYKQKARDALARATECSGNFALRRQEAVWRAEMFGWSRLAAQRVRLILGAENIARQEMELAEQKTTHSIAGTDRED